MVLPECPARLKALPRLAISPDQLGPTGVQLSSAQVHYLERVRRLSWGDPFLVFDGSGRLWQLIWQGQRSPLDQELEPLPRELPATLHLGLAVFKGSEFDETIRQLTELGVTEISPLLTQRTVVQPGETKRLRWQKIVVEAAEQSERLCWPQIRAPLPWPTWLQEQCSLQAVVIMAVARTQAPHMLTFLRESAPLPTRLAIAIGPEGGWTDPEIQQGLAAGAQLVGLGPRVLRAATAPVVLTGLVAAQWEAES